MSLPVTISDLNDDRVRLVSPLDPKFDAIASPLIGRRADRLLGLKPLMVIATNDTHKTVAAASLIFRVAKPVGGLTAWTNATFPDVVIGDLGSSHRPGVRPNESIVVALAAMIEAFDGSEPDDWYRGLVDEFLRGRNEELRDAQRVSIELNAVIFEDGTLIGKDDDGKLATLFAVRLAAYQGWLQMVADGLAAGQSVEAAFLPIQKFRDEVSAQGGGLRGLSGASAAAHVEKTNAAADVVRWRRRVGDADLTRVLSSLRLTPLVIRR